MMLTTHSVLKLQGITLGGHQTQGKRLLSPNLQRNNLGQQTPLEYACEPLSDLKLPSFDGQNCKSVAFALRAVESYKNVCLGYGDCIKSCERKAITLEKSGAVITTLCIGCGKCIHTCPKNLINLIPMDSSSFKSERTGKKIEWPDKKGFKIWESCYRIISQK